MAQSSKPDRIYRLWESTQSIIEFSRWLPEVVGTEGELRRIGSIVIARMPQNKSTIAAVVEEIEPLRFRDADVTKYRNLLAFFRRRHGR